MFRKIKLLPINFHLSQSKIRMKTLLCRWSSISDHSNAFTFQTFSWFKEYVMLVTTICWRQFHMLMTPSPGSVLKWPFPRPRGVDLEPVTLVYRQATQQYANFYLWMSLFLRSLGSWLYGDLQYSLKFYIPFIFVHPSAEAWSADSVVRGYTRFIFLTW